MVIFTPCDQAVTKNYLQKQSSDHDCGWFCSKTGRTLGYARPGAFAASKKSSHVNGRYGVGCSASTSSGAGTRDTDFAGVRKYAKERRGCALGTTARCRTLLYWQLVSTWPHIRQPGYHYVLSIIKSGEHFLNLPQCFPEMCCTVDSPKPIQYSLRFSPNLSKMIAGLQKWMTLLKRLFNETDTVSPLLSQFV